MSDKRPLVWLITSTSLMALTVKLPLWSTDLGFCLAVYLWCVLITGWAVWLFARGRGWSRGKAAAVIAVGGFGPFLMVAGVICSRTSFKQGEFEAWGRMREDWRRQS
jgi:hypothetical protein